MGFSLNSFSVPGLISCVRVNVFCLVFCFCCCYFLLFGFIHSPLVPYFTALWCRKKQKQKNKKSKKKKKKRRAETCHLFPLHCCFSWGLILMLSNYGVGEDSWESLGLRGDQPVNHKGNQHWIFTGRTDAEVETPILWLPDAKSWLIGKDFDLGKIEGRSRGQQKMR